MYEFLNYPMNSKCLRTGSRDFSPKTNASNYGTVNFNNIPVIRENIQKDLGLDSKLNVFDHINEKVKKATKRVNFVRKINLFLPPSSLQTIYKSFVRPHLDYADVICDQPNNSRLSDKMETVQYNATLGITGAIRGTSKEKIYQDVNFSRIGDG